MSRTPIHPGEQLAEELDTIGVSADELASDIKVPSAAIAGIIEGRRPVDAETALRLGHWFGTSGQFWLNLQSLYELRLAAKRKAGTIAKLPKLEDRLRGAA